ncbi:MAG: hypothetical protein ACLPXZ_26085 [Mycobacterium sp.]
MGKRIVNWEHALKEKWVTLRFGDVKVQTNTVQHIFEVEVYLNDLDPEAVMVELYTDDVTSSAHVRQEMKRVRQLAGASGGYVYSTVVPANRPATDYTARVIPHCEGVAVPLEDAHILWQR